MKEYRDFRRGADFYAWCRAPEAEVFTKELGANVDSAHRDLLGRCATSTDPKVTAALERWKTLSELTTFLANARKERAGDDE